MTLSRMPEPDRAVLDRSGAIIKDLETLIGLEGVISEEEGRRAFETDALTAYRQIPLAVVLPRTTEDVSRGPQVLLPEPTEGGAARRRYVAVRRRAADGRLPSSSAPRA